MSKKLAVGAEALVLDVKVGEGAFVTEVAAARELAQLMVAIGERAGKRVAALMTRMEEPLGAAVGDALELGEAVSTLSGRGRSDFAELCEVVAGHMASLGGAARSPEEGRLLAREGLQSGLGLAKLRELVQTQGGDPRVLEDVAGLLQGTESAEIRVKSEGYITTVKAREIGLTVRDLKSIAGDRGHQCGVVLRKKVGDWVGGEAVGTVIAPAGLGDTLERATDRSARAFRVDGSAPRRGALVLGVVVGEAAGGTMRPGPASGERG
jgi:thymidine phosphorylase